MKTNVVVFWDPLNFLHIVFHTMNLLVKVGSSLCNGGKLSNSIFKVRSSHFQTLLHLSCSRNDASPSLTENLEVLTEKMDLRSDLCSDLRSDLWSDLWLDPWSDLWFDLWSDLRCDLHLDLWNKVKDTFRTLKNTNFTPEIHKGPSSRMPLMLLVSIRILLFSIWHFQFNLRVCPRRQFQTLLCFSGLLPLSAEPKGRQP